MAMDTPGSRSYSGYEQQNDALEMTTTTKVNRSQTCRRWLTAEESVSLLIRSVDEPS